ncbi:MAG TPA: hypothetical protein PK413_04880, partial [Thermoanaerobaculia bacterium]|nr:hypothetical protein [Thermoanaerobaculia bacterium]
DTDAGPAKRVVLFSDGEQNTPPNATPGGGGALDVGGSPYPPEIVVCPVTAGNMSAVGFSLQQNIANSRCNGRNAHIEGNNQTFLEADLQTHFAQLASTTIFGDKLEPARDLTGTLAPLATATESFRANPEDVSLSVILGWEGRGAAEGRVVFTLEAPDGTAIDLGGRTRFGTRFSITTLPLPVIQGGVTVKTRGEWKLHLASANLPTTANYHLIVLLDNRSLTSDFTSPIADPGTGEAIPLRVSLREGGAPVTGATVKALVIGPKEGLGDILSSAFGGNITPPAQDPGANPLANGKLLALQNDASFAGRFGVRNLPVVTLRDDGTGGDATANDGLYSGSFQAADEEGHYHFFYSATGNAPANGDFERSWHSSVFVRPKPDPTNTTFQVLSIVPVAGSLRVTLSAQPRDRFRNLLGPGYLGSLSIQVAGGTVVSPLADKLDGSYEISYDIPSGSNPDATLEVLGKPVIVRPLGNLPGGSTLLPPGSGGGAGGWRLSLHLGRTDPRGHLGTFTDGGPSFGLDLEKAVNSHFSCELYGGQDRFDTNLLGGSDVKLSMLTLRGRWYFLTGSVQPSVFAGAGLFHENGGSTTGGVEVGAAVDWWLWPNVALEASAAFRNADGGNRKYGLLQAGARIKL